MIQEIRRAALAQGRRHCFNLKAANERIILNRRHVHIFSKTLKIRQYQHNDYTKSYWKAVSAAAIVILATIYEEKDGRSSCKENALVPSMDVKLYNRVTDNYTIGKALGEGSYGMVYEAIKKDSGGRVALKKISKKEVTSDSFTREVNTLKTIYSAGGHCNIAGIEDIFEDNQSFYLVMELVSGGEVFEHLCKNGPYSEAKAASFMKELAQALSFLHSKGIVHADLKPENLMLSSWEAENSCLKVVDFGCSMPVGHKVNSKSSPFGTTAYLPPETLKKDENSELFMNPSIDMWSAGLILYILLTGRHPFDPEGLATDHEMIENICYDDVPIMDLGDDISSSAKDLISKLMEKNPSKRLSAQKMLEHPWIQGKTAATVPLESSDKRLSKFQEILRQKLENGFVSFMVNRSMSNTGFAGGYTSGNASEKLEVGEALDAIKRAYDAFDKEGKGKISVSDILRVMKEQGGSLSEEDGKALEEALSAKSNHPVELKSLGSSSEEVSKSSRSTTEGGIDSSEFEFLLNNLKTENFTTGSYIFKEGDPPDGMYFITSGKVEVLVEMSQQGEKSRPNTDDRAQIRVSIMGAGDFFGEAGLVLNEERSASIRALTPVSVIKVDKESCSRFLASTGSACSNLKEVAFSRQMIRAKSFLRALNSVRQIRLQGGEVIFNQGEPGNSMYNVISGTIDVMKSNGCSGPRTVAVLQPGTYFGEMAILLHEPRNATVACSKNCEYCIVEEVRGDDFVRLLLSRPSRFRRDIEQLTRARQLRHDIYKILTEQENLVPTLDSKVSFTEKELKLVFDAVDSDGSGEIDQSELAEALFRVDSGLTEEGVKEIMAMMDLDSNQSISFQEFVKIITFDP